MRLIIAEKKIQAKSIADGVSPIQSDRGTHIVCGQNESDIITWASGHLYEQPKPEYYNPKFEKWSLADLPFFPGKGGLSDWVLIPIENKRKQLDAINALIAQADIIVNACDFDREGQAIGDEIIGLAPKKKPSVQLQRLILRGLSKPEVELAFKDIRDNAEFTALGESAVARSRMDWSYGFNMSRALTILGREAGYSHNFNIGRVKTPTLALVVNRDREIENFVPVDYFQSVALLKHDKGQFIAIWRPRDGIDGVDENKRIRNRGIADALIHRVKGRSGRVTINKTEEIFEKPSLPHDMTTLQIECNEKHGLTAVDVLAAAQTLYEAKLISYPRPNCKFLPEEQHADALSILLAIAKNDSSKSDMASNANPELRSEAWNDARVGSHHAIIPLAVIADLTKFNDKERAVYDLICRAYIAQFYEAAQYRLSGIECLIANESFEARERDLVSPGWKLLYPAKSEKQSEKMPLPVVEMGDRVTCIDIEVLEKQTSPPQRFTDATLVQAMEKIEKFIEDEEVKRSLKGGGGIGTDATRADHIDHLMEDKYATRNNKQIISTRHGRETVDAVPDEMKSPALTAMYEQILKKVEEKELSMHTFLDNQFDVIKEMVAGASVKRRTPRPDDEDETGGDRKRSPKRKSSRQSFQHT
jgi:DNA topoisomerase-3